MGSSDSKIEFKTMFSKLGENYIKHNEHNFWKHLFIQPLSIDDIFSVIAPDDIRSLRITQPANLGTIIYKCIEQLYLFSQPKNYSAEGTSAKNSLHLLTRILPFIFEHDNDGFVTDLFFNNVLPGSAGLQSVVGGATKHALETKQETKPQQETAITSEQNPTTSESTTTTATTESTTSSAEPAATESTSTTATTEQIEQIKQGIEQLKEKVEQKLETPPVETTTTEPSKETVVEPPKVEEPVKEPEVPKETPKEVAKEVQKPPVVVETTSSKKKNKKNKKKNKKGGNSKEEEKQVVEPVVEQQTETPTEVSSQTTSVEESSTTTTSETVEENQLEEEPIKQEESVPQPEEPVKVEEPKEEQQVNDETATPVDSTAATTTTTTATTEENQVVAEETTPEESATAKLLPILKIADTTLTTTLAEVMIQTLMRCLFLPDFTVPISQLHEEQILIKSDSLDESVLWQTGMSTHGKPLRSASWEQMENRNDILRCMLTCFSSVLYKEAEKCSEYDNKFVTIAVSEKIPNAHNLLYSLLNFVTSYDPRGSLPYSSQLFTDYYTQYIETSLHMIAVLLQHKPKNQINVYHHILQQFNNTVDMTHLYSKLTLLLRNVVDSHYTYLPSSQKLIEFYEEVLLLFWLILGEAPIFRVFVCKELHITDLLIPLLFIIQLHSKQLTKFPIVQLASFTILLLSGNREFGVALNQPYKITAPLDVPAFEGNYADLLILFFNKIMVTDKGAIRGLYDCMLTIIANISPYTKSLTMLSSVKLLNLFEAFASPRFLYSSERNHQFVALLLEVFNNIIQYQYEGNVHVIYSILRRGKLFQDIEKEPDLEPIKSAILKRHEQKVAENPNQPLPEPFIPTAEWVQSWRPRLPIYTILTLISTLSPDIERICSKEYATEEDVIVYLKNTTLVGLLPVPHTIIIRTFQGNPKIDTFIITFVWGCVYVKMSTRVPWVDSKQIKLFTILV